MSLVHSKIAWLRQTFERKPVRFETRDAAGRTVAMLIVDTFEEMAREIDALKQKLAKFEDPKV